MGEAAFHEKGWAKCIFHPVLTWNASTHAEGCYCACCMKLNTEGFFTAGSLMVIGPCHSHLFQALRFLNILLYNLGLIYRKNDKTLPVSMETYLLLNRKVQVCQKRSFEFVLLCFLVLNSAYSFRRAGLWGISAYKILKRPQAIVRSTDLVWRTSFTTTLPKPMAPGPLRNKHEHSCEKELHKQILPKNKANVL